MNKLLLIGIIFSSAIMLVSCEALGLTPKAKDYRDGWVGNYDCHLSCERYNLFDPGQSGVYTDVNKTIKVEKGDTDSTVVVDGFKTKVESNGKYLLYRDYGSNDPHDYIVLELWYTKKGKSDSLSFATSTGTETAWDKCTYIGVKQK